MAEKQEIVQPEQLNFEDDGVYPGSVLPVLLYRSAITIDAQDRASRRFGFEATVAAARALVTVGLHDHVADVARVSGATVEQPAVEHDASTDAG